MEIFAQRDTARACISKPALVSVYMSMAAQAEINADVAKQVMEGHGYLAQENSHSYEEVRTA